MDRWTSCREATSAWNVLSQGASMNGANMEAVLEPGHIPVTRFPVGLRSGQVVGQVLTRVVGRLAVKVKALVFPGSMSALGPCSDTPCPRKGAGCWLGMPDRTTALRPFKVTAITRGADEISILREPPHLVQETDRKLYLTKNLYLNK